MHLSDSLPDFAARRIPITLLQTLNTLSFCFPTDVPMVKNFLIHGRPLSWDSPQDFFMAANSLMLSEWIFNIAIFLSSMTCQCCQKCFWLWPLLCFISIKVVSIIVYSLICFEVQFILFKGAYFLWEVMWLSIIKSMMNHYQELLLNCFRCWCDVTLHFKIYYWYSWMLFGYP